MKQILVTEPGRLTYSDVPDPQAGPGQVLVRIEAAGVNFANSNVRRNPPRLPAPIGTEGAGTVLAVGPDITEFGPGDRVAFNGVQGAYAERMAVPAERIIRLPDNVSAKQAAASFVQGVTAHYLACSTYPLQAGDTCLVHAAAGGVGVMLCQIARIRGARVIGTVSTEAKARVAREAGASDTIVYTKDDFVEEVRRLTDGRGVDVVYDAVGQTTFVKGLACIRPRGMMVSYGQSSGPIGPIDPALLGQHGSLYLARTGLADHTATRQELVERATAVFSWISSGDLKVYIHAELPLREAGAALDMIAGRETIGKVLLTP